jgi:hypothetical protein
MTLKMVVPTLGSLLVRVGVMKLFIGGYKRVTPEFRSASGYPEKICNCSNLANFMSPNLPVDFTDEESGLSWELRLGLRPRTLSRVSASRGLRGRSKSKQRIINNK